MSHLKELVIVKAARAAVLSLSKIAKVTRVTRVEVEERGHKYPSFCKDLKFPLELKHFEFDGVYEMMQL